MGNNNDVIYNLGKYRVYQDGADNLVFNSIKCEYERWNEAIEKEKRHINHVNDMLIMHHKDPCYKYLKMFTVLTFLFAFITIGLASRSIYARNNLISTFEVDYRKMVIFLILTLISTMMTFWGMLTKGTIKTLENDIARTETRIAQCKIERDEMLNNYFKEIKCPKCKKPMKINLKDMGICRHCGYIKPRYRK